MPFHCESRISFLSSSAASADYSRAVQEGGWNYNKKRHLLDGNDRPLLFNVKGKFGQIYIVNVPLKRTFHVMKAQNDSGLPISGGAWGGRRHADLMALNLASIYEQMIDGSGE